MKLKGFFSNCDLTTLKFCEKFSVNFSVFNLKYLRIEEIKKNILVSIKDLFSILARLQSNSGLWIDDVCLSICLTSTFWLTFVFKFWNLLCFVLTLLYLFVM